VNRAKGGYNTAVQECAGRIRLILPPLSIVQRRAASPPFLNLASWQSRMSRSNDRRERTHSTRSPQWTGTPTGSNSSSTMSSGRVEVAACVAGSATPNALAPLHSVMQSWNAALGCISHRSSEPAFRDARAWGATAPCRVPSAGFSRALVNAKRDPPTPWINVDIGTIPQLETVSARRYHVLRDMVSGRTEKRAKASLGSPNETRLGETFGQRFRRGLETRAERCVRFVTQDRYQTLIPSPQGRR